jgi:type II restriction enzyme
LSVTKAYSHHIRSSKDLVTPYEATRAGFVSLALEKNRRATPTVVEARTLKSIASTAKSPADLLKIARIWPALLTAAGVSEKAAGHMLQEDKDQAITGLIKDFLEPAGADFVEELVYRFLLTRGDSLGGSMRNIGGELARQKLTRTIIGTLSLSGNSFHWLNSHNNSWVQGKREDASIELHTKGLSWTAKGNGRTLLFDRSISIVGNRNIDMVLVEGSFREVDERTLKIPNRFIALGELKGGIDPAGADEHWKTARTALSRIRESFSKKEHSPLLIFVGAAIEKKMAEEIWSDLESGKLQNAANLTNVDQLTDLCTWLCQI